MVGSSFILTRRDKRLTLLNIAEIASMYTEDFDRSTRRGQVLYSEYEPGSMMLYTIQLLLTSRREMEYVFKSMVERDALFEEILKAVSPSVTIDIVEPMIQRVVVPATPGPDPKIVYNGYTAEEIDHAMAVLKATRAREQATPPAPKPPRKPRAKKGEE